MPAPKAATRKPRVDNLLDAIKSIEDAGAGDRLHALDNLIFLFDKRTRQVEAIKDKEYHRTLEALFRCINTEKTAYFKAKRGRSSASTSAARLTKCAEAIRIVLDHGSTKLKRNTLAAVVDHITQTLPDSEEGYLQPLLLEYVRALLAMLSYPSVVESLATYSGVTWLDCIDFILEVIDWHLESHAGTATPSRDSPAPGTPQALSHPGSTLRSTATSSSQRGGHGLHQTVLHDLLECLCLLISAPNAPVLKRSAKIKTSALQCIRLRFLGVSSVLQLGFFILNVIVQVTQTEDTTQTNQLVAEILPLIRQWWQAKTTSQENALLNSIQVEALKLLFNVHINVAHLVQSGDSGIVMELEELCDMLWNQYSQREGRSQLQQDDLTFSNVPQHPHAFQVGTFALRLYNVEAERKWAVIHILAIFEAILWKQSRSHHGVVEENDEHPRKRRRIAQDSNRLHQKLKMPRDNMRMMALQLIPFFVSHVRLSVSDVEENLSIMASLVGHKNAKLSTWATIASASLASAEIATHKDLLPIWKQLWYMAARNLSISATCRASSVLLSAIVSNDLLSYHEISDDINNIITAADVSGPSVVVDSSVILMTKLLQIRNYRLPSASHATCNHVIRWLFLRWDPADPIFVSVYSIHVAPLDIINLFRAASGLPSLVLKGHPQLISGPLVENWSMLQDRLEIVRYLLLVNDDEPRAMVVKPTKASPNQYSLQNAESADSHAVRKLIAELMHPKADELQALCESWSKKGEGSSQITIDKFRSLLNCLVVIAFTLVYTTELNTRHSQDLEVVSTQLLRHAFEVAWLSSENQVFSETTLKTVRPYLPCCSTSALSDIHQAHPQVLAFFSELSSQFDERMSQHSSSYAEDTMDLDEDFGTQESHSSTTSRTIDICRRDTALLDAGAFIHDTTQRLRFLHAIQLDPGQIGLVPSAYIRDLLALADEELVSCRLLNKELFSGDLVVGQEDAMRVTHRFGDLIDSKNFCSCEVAMHAFIDTIEGFMPIWIDERSELSSEAEQLYEFLIEKALTNNLLSPKTQIALTRLLFRLTEIDEKFPERFNLPTTISSIFSMLQNSSISIKFYIGNNLFRIFNRFVLKTHDQYCIDVVNSLPLDPEVPEGISLRLYVLSQLAKNWPTLLRRCVYHIFETPGNLLDSTRHATYCLEDVALSLRLENAQGLFDLFAPQLLYTWLNTDPIESIPFGIFGFQTLEDLLLRAQPEAAAILMMRGQDEDFANLAQLLGKTPAELAKKCFSKILAYSMAYDISMPKSDQHTNGESRIRKLLGREIFLDYVYTEFADVIGTFFGLIDQEDPIEKSWAKDDSCVYAAKIMDEIKTLSHSDVELSGNQQPCFRAKYLTREIAILCSRTEHEMKHLFTPALVVSVARRLFNTRHSALGSLHACSVIRKVRVLICLAGQCAYESYSLEMLLHSVQPYLTDLESADDALGISQYLLMRGLPTLSRNPSFVAGYALSTLASLRVFLESSQASTTQESQFKATMSKAQKFHKWLSQYLEDYQSPSLRDEQHLSSFKSITQSAASVRSSGNAERGTHESTLLLEILQDETRQAPLLSESSRQSALRILAKDFRLPVLSRQDAIYSDIEATKFATAIWKTLHAQPTDNDYRNYRVWAGRVIGKSFATSGHVDETLLRESKLAKHLQYAPSSTTSEKGLLSLLQSLTSDADCFTAGLAESALRNIVSEAASAEDNVLSEACGTVLSEQLLLTSDWSIYRTPPSDDLQVDAVPDNIAFAPEALEDPFWARQLAIHLTQSVKKDVVLGALPQVLRHVKGFAEDAFPFIIHLVLLAERDKQQLAKKNLSIAMKSWLKATGPAVRERLGLLINAVLYLRAQKLPGEHSIADRTQWLDVDLATAAAAATHCGMHKTALLLVESSSNEGSRQSRRSSAIRAQESTDVLLEIFENIDDPDAYYGLQDGTDLSNILARLEYENDGAKSLAFRGAQFDSHTRKRDVAVRSDERHLVKTLNTLGLSGLSHSLLQAQQGHDGTSAAVDSTFINARRLEIWDLPVPAATENPSVALYKAYQGCHQAANDARVTNAIHGGFHQVMQNLVKSDATTSHIRSNLNTLAALSEMDDALNISSASGLNDLLSTFDARLHWMNSGRYDNVSHLLSTRWTTLSMLGKSIQTQPRGDVNLREIKLAEAQSLLSSSKVYRFHSAHQESLNIATALNDSIDQAADLGLTIDAAARIEVAHSLWDHGEMVSSIRMLQSVADDSDLKKQDIEVRRSDLLAEIGHQVSVARLEKPESIQRNYLQPALKDLKGKTDGPDAGRVYHQFARFCDEQLQNPDGLEDLARLQHLKQGKSDEVAQLQQIVRNSKTDDQKRRAQNHLVKAKQWLELDDQELRRVEQSRSEFVRLSLENYLLSLTASDEHNNDALRFTALWLESAGEDYTSEAVKKHIEKVPTRKFATLMNQLTSRLIDRQNLFQKLLLELIYRICLDHPYHGMYQVWSGTKSRTNKEDDIAVLRQKATERIAKRLSQNPDVSDKWRAIDKTNKSYHLLAVDRNETRYKAGQKMPIKDVAAGNRLVMDLREYRIPPPTLQIELVADRDYSRVPLVSKVDPSMSIASGVSAPKIITLVGSDGMRYKQLVKGGSDDLRQDAIMEQVFAAASSVLKLHRSTQQRNLGIRTYKVLPLTASSGLIEFVPNTTPLHEYLMPAHERYHPKDLKGSSCRKEISQVQSKSVETRLATFKRVMDRFQPVMRYFFMEHFVDPDEWYAKRTNYTRTTAAISILGHVLGLGDRHGHNILLDTVTGEVVHIDLGVAFEMGRVLPVPELVPFRLTRDIVDGMGVTKTEGIFRRCCEFTLDALREETYSIMTILDVLRYDPLYSWSISPVRMAKLQDTRRDEETGADQAAESVLDLKKKAASGLVNEPSEADRALEVVRKKLSKTLSVTATVNDLINQAVDERNLAVLYSGWAAYA
ncbi:hypothetical protein PFICI_12168 [Pestalotiopsis fici W106-1]|uniref:Serine/threonine-protein kinase Tel1 n=1 Tax=Pestalotiopsis fici (strain W106-1 / CGMCC3.15140) TaxID=1229662 RepID=W3WVB4_PESFW|nr:uncharacterized protein PFICI_12168 [Pestalotiopsis fici W106-1]ETS76781.1 hypothetical protein PFICI_12168 [Pestalotiopsis fici W106-1]